MRVRVLVLCAPRASPPVCFRGRDIEFYCFMSASTISVPHGATTDHVIDKMLNEKELIPLTILSYKKINRLQIMIYIFCILKARTYLNRINHIARVTIVELNCL